MNIVLLGYRGSGKTSIGRRLASQLWMDMVDLDEEVCRRFGIDSVAAIWEQHGEDAFRELECIVVVEVLARDNRVVALGGGTVMQLDGNRAVAQASNAVRIYLRCEPEELHRRIVSDPNTEASRPHLTDLGGGIEEIRSVLEQRDPVYTAVADHVLDVTRLGPDDAARYIVKRCL